MKMILFALYLAFGLLGGALADEEQQGANVQVRTAPLRKMMLYSRISGYGTVVAEPGATLNVNFPRAGRVTRVAIIPGQRVRRGQELLDIATDPAATLAYAQAENALAYARGELTRIRSLYASQLATRSQVEAASRALKDAEGALAAQRASGDGVKLDRLTAPFDATVASVGVADGDRFAAGTNLAQLIRTNTLRVRLGIEPEDSRKFLPGMQVRLASVFGQQHALEGEIMQVAGQVDAQTQLVDVTVSFKGGALLLGSKVRGEIATLGHEAQAVPRQAVLRDGNGAYLFQVVRGRAHRIGVKTGIEDGNWIEVTGSLLPGAPIVVLGNYELENGMAVRESGQ